MGQKDKATVRNQHMLSYASPGFCRLDMEGIHLLNRFAGHCRIDWKDVRALRLPRGNCRHDYLTVLASAGTLASEIPVADVDHAEEAAQAILRFMPNITVH